MKKMFISGCVLIKETSDFHGSVSFQSVKMSQQKLNQNVYQTSDTHKMVIILSSYLEEVFNLK